MPTSRSAHVVATHHDARHDAADRPDIVARRQRFESLAIQDGLVRDRRRIQQRHLSGDCHGVRHAPHIQPQIDTYRDGGIHDDPVTDRSAEPGQLGLHAVSAARHQFRELVRTSFVAHRLLTSANRSGIGKDDGDAWQDCARRVRHGAADCACLLRDGRWRESRTQPQRNRHHEDGCLHTPLTRLRPVCAADPPCSGARSGGGRQPRRQRRPGPCPLSTPPTATVRARSLR